MDPGYGEKYSKAERLRNSFTEWRFVVAVILSFGMRGGALWVV